jgi:DNA-binding MarR family transcriptional regulator
MSRARSPDDGSTAGRRSAAEVDDEATTKVVLMELVDAGHPLAASTLEERTLLSSTAVDAAVAALTDMGLCRTLPADDRRPERYAATEPPRRPGSASGPTAAED